MYQLTTWSLFNKADLMTIPYQWLQKIEILTSKPRHLARREFPNASLRNIFAGFFPLFMVELIIKHILWLVKMTRFYSSCVFCSPDNHVRGECSTFLGEVRSGLLDIGYGSWAPRKKETKQNSTRTGRIDNGFKRKTGEYTDGTGCFLRRTSSHTDELQNATVSMYTAELDWVWT